MGIVAQVPILQNFFNRSSELEDDSGLPTPLYGYWSAICPQRTVGRWSLLEIGDSILPLALTVTIMSISRIETIIW